MTPQKTKLSKDEIQKMVLSALGFVGLLYVYFSFFLGPLSKSRTASEARIADLQTKITSSRTELLKTSNLEQQATEATSRFEAFKALSPEGAPIAWFPPRMKLFFTNQQIEKSTARLEGNGAFKQPELADWQRYTWQIDLPQTNFATAGKALAQLENTEPLLSVSRISIKADANDPQFQQVNLTANTTVLKR
jgi:type II secretory pathway component PulM